MIPSGNLIHDLLVAGLLFFVAAPFIAITVPKAKLPLRLSALGSLLFASLGILGPTLLRYSYVSSLKYVAQAVGLVSPVLFYGGLAAAVYCVVLVAKEEPLP